MIWKATTVVKKKSHRNESGREIFLPRLVVPVSKVFTFLAEMGGPGRSDPSDLSDPQE